MSPQTTGQSKSIAETFRTKISQKRLLKARRSSSQRFWIAPNVISQQFSGIRRGQMENPNSGLSHLSILVVDDEPNIRRTLCIFLEGEGHSVIAVGKTKDALAEASRRYFDLALIDLRLGTESGMDLITSLHATCPWIKLVVCTAHASIDSTVEAMKRGAFDYLAKPFTRNQVGHVISKVAEVRVLEQKLSALQEIYDEAVPEAILESLKHCHAVDAGNGQAGGGQRGNYTHPW